jgi:hypothetical protein
MVSLRGIIKATGGGPQQYAAARGRGAWGRPATERRRCCRARRPRAARPPRPRGAGRWSQALACAFGGAPGARSGGARAGAGAVAPRRVSPQARSRAAPEPPPPLPPPPPPPRPQAGEEQLPMSNIPTAALAEVQVGPAADSKAALAAAAAAPKEGEQVSIAGRGANFRSQAGALYRKNAVYQRRNWCSNVCLLSAPIFFCLLLFGIQTAINKLLLTGDAYSVRGRGPAWGRVRHGDPHGRSGGLQAAGIWQAMAGGRSAGMAAGRWLARTPPAGPAHTRRPSPLTPLPSAAAAALAAASMATPTTAPPSPSAPAPTSASRRPRTSAASSSQTPASPTSVPSRGPPRGPRCCRCARRASRRRAEAVPRRQPHPARRRRRAPRRC